MEPGSGAIEELLSHYAAGRLLGPLHALVASHLDLSPRNRGFVQALEDWASRQIEADGAVALADRDAALATIFAAPAPVPSAVAAPGKEAGSAPLAALIAHAQARDRASLPWRRYLPGVRRVAIASSKDAGEVNFYWIKAGKRWPAHTHTGQEITLVLRGGFSDVTGHYARGDIAIADAEIDHRPVADSDEDCICFAVTDAPLLLTGPIGSVVQHLLGGRR